MIKMHMQYIWFVTKKHSRKWWHDIVWHFSHVKFYADRISKHYAKIPYNPEEDVYWLKPELDPKKYPFDKEKADAALYEVRQWISEDNKPKGK